MGGCTASSDILGSLRPIFWTIVHHTLTSKPGTKNLDSLGRPDERVSRTGGPWSGLVVGQSTQRAAPSEQEAASLSEPLFS